MKRWGFELTAVALRTLRGAASSSSPIRLTTQVIEGGAGDRQYVELSRCIEELTAAIHERIAASS